MTDIIHIACSANGRFIPDCGVMLHSLFTANPGARFDIHFLHDGEVPQKDMSALEALVTGFGSRWSPLRIGDDMKANFPFMSRYGGFTAWYRVLLPKLLPELPRILYLDVDLLILDDVRPLWDLDLGGKCLAAVTNPLLDHMVERVQRDLGLPDRHSYFNSGVMLLDLDALRAGDYSSKVISFIRNSGVDMPWADQEPLNAVLHTQRVHLPPRWNTMTAVYELPWKMLPWDKAALTEARDRPGIIHFIGAYKPWHYRSKHPYRKLYFKHLGQTAWKGRPIEGRTLWHMALRPLPVLLQWKIESAQHQLPKRLNRALDRRSAAASLAIDAYRWLTPSRNRSPVTTVLEAFAYGREQVRFVQVGSNDATHGDPLRKYILERDWTGVMIEPVPYIFERLQANYRDNPRLKLENVAIAETDGVANFYYVAQSGDDLPEWYDQLGSFSLETILKHETMVPDLRKRIGEMKVPCMRFETLCAKHGINLIDLIHIDAEGYDDRILQSIDLARHQPTIVLYEHKHLGPEQRARCHALLHGAGYEFIEGRDDTICVRRAELGKGWSRLARSWRLQHARQTA